MRTFVDVTDLVDELLSYEMVNISDVNNYLIKPDELSDDELLSFLKRVFNTPYQMYDVLELCLIDTFSTIDVDVLDEVVEDWTFEQWFEEHKDFILKSLMTQIAEDYFDEDLLAEDIKAWYLIDEFAYDACVALNYICFERYGLYFFGSNDFLHQYAEILKIVNRK